MYHFYSLSLFLLGLFISTVCKGFTSDPEIQLIFLVFQIIFGAISGINFFIFFFSNLDAQHQFVKQINSIRTLAKKIVITQEKFDILKKYYEENLMKLYPEHEKDIFEQIASSRPKDLNVLLEKYPKLKSSAVIEKLFRDLKDEMDNLYQKKSKYEDKVQYLYNMKHNPWLLLLPEIPSDLWRK